MATWDGSLQGDTPEDDYYYQYSAPQAVESHQRWNFYNSDTNYTENTHNLSGNVNLPVNTFQNYQENSSTTNRTTNLPNNSNYYVDKTQPHHHFSQFEHQTGTTSNENASSRPRNIDPQVVTQSNLHPEANEFIPTNLSTLENSPNPSKTFFGDNRNKFPTKKYENRRNNNGNYSNSRQQNGEYGRNAFKNFEKNGRKNKMASGQAADNYSNESQDHLNGLEASGGVEGVGAIGSSRENLMNSSGDAPRSYKNRRTRNNNKFQGQNDGRYSNNRHYGNFSPGYQGSSSKSRPVFGAVSSGESEKQRMKMKDAMSRDPRDEDYRSGPSFNQNHHLENEKIPKKDKKRVKSKDLPANISDKEEKFSNRADFYDEKGAKDRRANQGSYRNNYERDSKADFHGGDDIVGGESGIQTGKRNQKTTNWRQKTTANLSKKKMIDLDDAANQRERLTEQVNRGQLECLVCCDYIRQSDSVWSCGNCYHVLHLKCIRKWAESSQSESGWRCPACQNPNLVIPEEYFCFCGKTRDPEWNRRDVAHSCGEVCGRMRARNSCVHKCTLLCHPGSCPLCIAMVTRTCGCGRMSQNLKCSTDNQLTCDAICDKLLNCKVHNCARKCHHNECGACTQTIEQKCYCGKNTREVTCAPGVTEIYSCDQKCDKVLECSNHNCEDNCHAGECKTCSLKPELVTHCPCGKTPITSERKSCLDPIPTCDKICGKQLKCGQPSLPHTCTAECHIGDCPPCELTTWVKCRCGNMDREIPCADLTTKADDARCEKKCTKKRSCGKHKCNQLCCIDIEHICPLPCSKTLSCGRHKCELECHRGRCQPCYRSSFEELYCECGAAIIYPPVACGTRRPTCNQPCSRQHPCGHEVLHNCHSETTCPPCTVLTQKWCYGKHELRKAVPCYYNEISCGMPCGKPISCGRHKCITLCHPGVCEKAGQVCTQPCTVPRELCGHICAAPCHEGKCPDTPCKEMVKVTCTCGHRSMTRACAENSREYQRIASGILASKMADMQLGHSVDLEEVFGQSARKQNQLKTLECNDECKLIERNRKLALGLQIVNPDLSSKLLPRYSDYMKQWAKKDAGFCQRVHDKLTELVQLAKTSKQKSRSYSFDSMNREKRHFVHEACEHFGCESQAYDQEPKRNVVATAVKDKCWMPSYSLLEIIQRENGQRKVPRPMLNSTKTNTLISRTSEVLPSTARKTQMLQPSTSTSKSPEREIDYFDYQGSKWHYM